MPVALLCISVKLKNLKANHNDILMRNDKQEVVYIRKVKKSESKSQHILHAGRQFLRCVYP